jgi:hypothetical protein
VTVRDATTKLVDEVANGDACRSDLYARLSDPARNRIAPQTRTPVPAEARPPGGALLKDVANPEKRLDVVDQRRAAEQTGLERVGRLVPRQSALAFDTLDQGRFLAADIGSGSPPQE